MQELLAEADKADRGAIQGLDASALADYRLQHVPADSALFEVTDRHRNTADRSAVCLVATFLAHRAKEAGIDSVRMPVGLLSVCLSVCLYRSSFELVRLAKSALGCVCSRRLSAARKGP